MVAPARETTQVAWRYCSDSVIVVFDCHADKFPRDVAISNDRRSMDSLRREPCTPNVPMKILAVRISIHQFGMNFRWDVFVLVN